MHKFTPILTFPLKGGRNYSWRYFFLLLALFFLSACAGPSYSPSSKKKHHTILNKTSSLPQFIDHSVGNEEMSIQAMGLIGLPYVWGGNNPEEGFDCSGLVNYVVARAKNVSLPRTALQISQEGIEITPDKIAPGDLVFFNTSGHPFSHVGIYIGKNRFVDSPSSGGTVRISYITHPYWAQRFNGIRRVMPEK